MKRIYVISETGRVWNRAGMEWIETVFKPSVNETDETCAYMGAIYNCPSVFLDELTNHPDSHVLLSYEHISSISGPEVQELCNRLRAAIEGDQNVTSWQVFRQFVQEDLDLRAAC